MFLTDFEVLSRNNAVGMSEQITPLSYLNERGPDRKVSAQIDIELVKLLSVALSE